MSRGGLLVTFYCAAGCTAVKSVAESKKVSKKESQKVINR
jgi:hypothetical protein